MASEEPPGPDERLESYLDALFLELRGRPREVRRLLSEAEHHLRDMIDAAVAAGLSKSEATEQALRRFGPPSAVARGVPLRTAYLAVLGQLAETALLVLSMVCLAAGVAAVPAAIVGLTGSSRLITGDPAGETVTAARCHQLQQLVNTPDCIQALATHHLEEVLRSHLLTGWIGVVLLGLWWAVHAHRRSRPPVLPAGFALTVGSTLLATLAGFSLVFGIPAVTAGQASLGGVIGSADLVTTGATMMAAALAGWLVLAWRATRPARG